MLAKTSSAIAGPLAAALAAVAILVPLAVTGPLAGDPQPVACQNTGHCGG